MSACCFHDRCGERVTALNAEAVAAWDATVEAILAHAATAPEHLGRALAQDPGFALAHAVKGLLLLSLARRELVATAEACLRAAWAADAARPVTARERGYIEALALWLDEAPRRAALRLEAILPDHPRDALALKLSHGLRFMLGDQRAMLESLERHGAAFDDEHPLAAFIRGCHAFALEEQGHYDAAERLGRAAVALNPRDAWGRHAVAHVLEMTGRAEEGIGWLADGRSIAHANNLRFHIVWHLALFRLERRETAEVLRLYDEEIRAEPTDDYRDIANGASLLARLELAGVAVGSRWEELAAKAEARIEDRRLVFADLHYLLALIGAGRTDGARALADDLVLSPRPGDGPGSLRASRSGGLAAQGLIAFGAGDYAMASRLLGGALDGLMAIGGSHAQRDLFEQVHIESLVRAGERTKAARLLEDRLARRGGVNAFALRRLAAVGDRTTGRLAALAAAAAPVAIAH